VHAALPVRSERLAPVVLLPGVLGSAFSMRHVSRELIQRGHDVAVIDPLGMGASDRPAGANYSLDAQARRVLAVLDTLGWRDVVIAGHGTSATIALRAAAIAPRHVRGVVSIAGGPVDAQNTGGLQSAMRFAPLLDSPIGRSLGRRRFASQLRARSASPSWVSDSVVRVYLQPLEHDLRGSLRALHAMSVSVEPSSVRDVLREVRAPVIVVVGARRTEGSPTAEQLQLLDALPGAVRVDTIAGVGAMLHEEAPRDVAAAIARLTLGTVSAGGPDGPGQMTLRWRGGGA
jgi:pimeloyl-ACP methyl ester carboxylesterase